MAITSNATAIAFNDASVQTSNFSLTCGHAFTCQLCFGAGFSTCIGSPTPATNQSTLSFCTTGQLTTPTFCSKFRNFESAAGEAYGSTSMYTGGTIGCLVTRVGSVNTAIFTTTAHNAGSNLFPTSTAAALSLGTTSLRWATIWVTGGSLIVSDQNYKTDITPISDQEKAVALEIKRNIKRFKFKDAVAKKGFDAARYHFGCIAQEVEQIFRDAGLDPFQYGVVGYDIWYERFNPTTQRTEVVQEPTDGYVETTLYSVRYDELLSFIASAL